MRSVATAIVIVIGLSCVEPENGEMAFYADPCGAIFRAALLCGRESGGADPQAGGGEAAPAPDNVVATCQELCQILAECVGIVDPAELAQCVSECQTEVTPELRDCIIRERCNFNICFEGMGVP